MIVSLIVACARNRAIGIENRLPWHLPEDLKRFRTITSGHPVIMGRKTFESIGRPLPNRANIVVTRQSRYQPEGVQVARSLDDALARAKAAPNSSDEVFVIGGAEIYRLALPRADRLYITSVETDLAGDAFFPEWSSEDFHEISRERHGADERHAFAYQFLVLERKN